MGLTSDIAARIRQEVEARCGAATFTSFLETWSELTRKPASEGKKRKRVPTGLLAAFKLLDKELKPASISARVCEASFWHSDEVVIKLFKPINNNQSTNKQTNKHIHEQQDNITQTQTRS